MSLGNDLWLSYSTSSINDCNNWAKDVVLGTPRVSAAGQNYLVKTYPHRKSEMEKHTSPDLPNIPINGLFDDFYNQLQLASEDRRMRMCLPNNCTCSSRWITVHGFPPRNRDVVLQHFLTLGRVCAKRLCNGNWFHLCYANSVDCLRADLSTNCLPYGVFVRRWTHDPHHLINADGRCCIVENFGIPAAQKHWGNEIMDPVKRYNPFIKP